jgi:hypothetical protein
MGSGQIMLPSTYSKRLHRPKMRFILSFQVLQFALVSFLVQVALLLTIRMHRIDGTVAMTSALAGAVAIVGAWASPTGVPGAGVRGLAAPTRALP